MAYNEEKLARLKHLKQLAQKAKAESDAVATRVKALEDVGAQANVLETIKVNGVVQDIKDRLWTSRFPATPWRSLRSPATMPLSTSS